MKKYYIIEKEFKLYEDYFNKETNQKVINESAKEFMAKFGIESNLYSAGNDSFYIVPSVNDLEKFKGMFTQKHYSNGLRIFKKNSTIGKAWAKILKDNNLKVLGDLYFGFNYFNSSGRTREKIFNIEDVIYCSFESTNDFKNPKGFIEIKASDFHKIVEDYNEKILSEKENQNEN